MSSRIAGVLLIVLGSISCFLINEGTFMIVSMLIGGAAIAPSERERRQIGEVLHKKKIANSRTTRHPHYIRTDPTYE